MVWLEVRSHRYPAETVNRSLMVIYDWDKWDQRVRKLLKGPRSTEGKQKLAAVKGNEQTRKRRGIFLPPFNTQATTIISS